MIRRPLWVWAGFAAVVTVLGLVMAWMSVAMLSMEQREIDREVLETNVRRSLWRMDSFVAPIIAAEGARPYYTYEAFFNSPEAYNSLYEPLAWGAVREPSPLLTEESEFVQLHFQCSDGTVESPQVPQGNMRDVAEVDYVTPERIKVYDDRLHTITPDLRSFDFQAALSDAGNWSTAADQELVQTVLELADMDAGVAGAPVPQQSAQQMEEESRSSMVFNTERQFDIMRQKRAKARGGQSEVATAQPRVHEGPMTPVWVDDRLLLVRRVTVEDSESFQGCWLDWPALEQRLLGEVADLLPEATLMPIERAPTSEDAFVLRSIPVALEPGPIPMADEAGLTRLELSLLVAWVGMALAALAAAVLLQGVLALSERRASFVSIVTHELRTPLTTFRLYTDLLGERAGEPERQAHYVSTLGAEAGRLSQLVENALAYSRIERGRSGVVPQTTRLATIIERVRPCLEERAARAGMEIDWRIPEEHGTRTVLAQEAAAGQILTNLVDNACKYARDVDHPQITIASRISGRRLGIAVEDRGPGVEPRERDLLFAPFRKLSRDAAGSKPGIGLGLALSRRLARELGGDLVLDPGSTAEGACFVLWLRLLG
ncbi:MAG: HAMP domain-containing histidine kinase [Phycisphaerales bacterium]|nr:HAMP domain-containing histidine kinase [Phycisphaerales bacterium]